MSMVLLSNLKPNYLDKTKLVKVIFSGVKCVFIRQHYKNIFHTIVITFLCNKHTYVWMM